MFSSSTIFFFSSSSPRQMEKRRIFGALLDACIWCAAELETGYCWSTWWQTYSPCWKHLNIRPLSQTVNLYSKTYWRTNTLFTTITIQVWVVGRQTLSKKSETECAHIIPYRVTPAGFDWMIGHHEASSNSYHSLLVVCCDKMVNHWDITQFGFHVNSAIEWRPYSELNLTSFIDAKDLRMLVLMFYQTPDVISPITSDLISINAPENAMTIVPDFHGEFGRFYSSTRE